MERSLNAELRGLLAASRELVTELLEEGMEHYAREEAAEAPATRASPPQAPTARPSIPAAADPAEERARSATAPTLSSADTAPGPGAAIPPPRPAGVQMSLDSTLPAGRRPTLEEVRAALGECTRCRLHEGRTQIVFGDGNPEAELLFIGEGPGEQEDLRGIPFCGRAGELLTRMIERGLGIPRSCTYIANIVKCRPPQNRAPLVDEVSACRPFLDGQIDAIGPKVIVALGKPAASLLLGRDVPITKVRGIWQEYRGIPLMPTYHPAFLLRQYTPENRRLVWEDLRAALERARALGARFPSLDGG